MGINDLAVGRKDIYRIDPRIITILPGFNVRQPSPDKDSHIRFLADSIKEVGVKIPLTIRMENETPCVVDGECRLLASMLAISEGADIQSIPVMMEDRYASNEDRVMTMLTCNGGKPLTIGEKGEAYKRLLAWGWDEAKIAQKNGVSIQSVKSALTFSSLAPELRQMVNDGLVSATLVNQTVAENGENQAIETLKDAVESSTKAGKKKVTKRQIIGNDEVKCAVNWKIQGMKCYLMLKEIYETPMTKKDMLWERISAAGTLLAELEEKLTGKKVIGFKFEPCEIGYSHFMEEFIKKVGVIKEFSSDNKACIVEFDCNNSYYYPADQIEAHLVEDEEGVKEEIKQELSKNKVLICNSDLKIEDEIPTFSDGVMMLVSDDENTWYEREVVLKSNEGFYVKGLITSSLVFWKYAKPLEPTKEEQLTAILGSSEKVSQIMELFKN